jgi:hypothetical protein
MEIQVFPDIFYNEIQIFHIKLFSFCFSLDFLIQWKKNLYHFDVTLRIVCFWRVLSLNFIYIFQTSTIFNSLQLSRELSGFRTESITAVLNTERQIILWWNTLSSVGNFYVFPFQGWKWKGCGKAGKLRWLGMLTKEHVMSKEEKWVELRLLINNFKWSEVERCFGANMKLI